ncbi:MAG: M23 family metallopeptidase [Clostridia bacterium]|nr:M23 family metallopeptidase [Clostridia bacterium]
MNSPYNGKFRVSQIFMGAAHDGLDLVGEDSKEIYSTVNGVVERAGWENSADKEQGFGLYVRIKQSASADRYYFGHLSKVVVKVGQNVSAGDKIGIEGSTGKTTGSHCHYCVRGNGSKAQIRDINAISGIPNKLGIYNDGAEKGRPVYIVKKSWKAPAVKITPYISQARLVAKRYGYVIYDRNGKTITSYR